MNLKYHFLVIASGLISFHALFFDYAYAYLEPNSLSLVVQAMLGALVGVGIALKVYWEKIKYKFSSKISDSKDKDLDSK